jgi:hypothetical protein
MDEMLRCSTLRPVGWALGRGLCHAGKVGHVLADRMLRHDAGHQAQRRRQEHMYTKIGASTRRDGGLFAVQHGLPPEQQPVPA